MLKRIVFSLFVGALLFSVPAVSMADYDDFISESEFKKLKDACDMQFDNCENTCTMTSKQPDKCNQKCLKSMSQCYKNATKNAIEYSKLPEEAKKLWEQIAAKQDSGVRKCQDSFMKGLDKCQKKHLSKSQDDKAQKAFSECFNKGQYNTKQDKCLDNVMSKNSFKTKKMVKLLKGKKP